MKTKRTAKDLKVGDTFRKQGYSFTIAKISEGGYKNGTESLIVECSMNDNKEIDSVFHFKLDTKI